MNGWLKLLVCKLENSEKKEAQEVFFVLRIHREKRSEFSGRVRRAD